MKKSIVGTTGLRRVQGSQELSLQKHACSECTGKQRVMGLIYTLST